MLYVQKKWENDRKYNIKSDILTKTQYEGMVHAHFLSFGAWSFYFLLVGRLGNEENVGPFWVQILKMLE